MTFDLSSDVPAQPLTDTDLVEAQLLSIELRDHWQAPSEGRLRPIAIASAATLLRRFTLLPRLLPGFWSRLAQARRTQPANGNAAALDDAIQLLRTSSDAQSRREAALEVSALAYRLAESVEIHRAPAAALNERH